jgi:hypothetical protein
VKPPRNPRTSTVTRRAHHTTVFGRPPKRPKPAAPPQPRVVPKLTIPSPKTRPPAKGLVARLIDEDESTLLDVLDNLLDKGVVLNADVMLALANVDLVYLRLSAILCAAGRVLPSARR